MLFPRSKTIIRSILFYVIITKISSLICLAQNINRYEITGKWEVLKVSENDQDITSSIDNNAQRWIHFISHDRYESDGYPFGRYEGEYRLDEISGELILINGNSNKKGIKWIARYDGEYLILKGSGRLIQYTFFLKKTF